MSVRVRWVFVGRDPELATLAEHLGHARAGRPQVVVVEGDPGTGKTALVQGFVDGPGNAARRWCPRPSPPGCSRPAPRPTAPRSPSRTP